jgi:transcriptional regulator with XRE-family HTH domain
MSASRVRDNPPLGARKLEYAAFVRQALETARTTRAWNGSEVARRTGVSRQTINRWVRGDWQSDPEPERVVAFCEGLGLDPADAFAILEWGRPRHASPPRPHDAEPRHASPPRPHDAEPRHASPPRPHGASPGPPATPDLDPDIAALLRRWADPALTEQERFHIRETVRYLAYRPGPSSPRRAM